MASSGRQSHVVAILIRADSAGSAGSAGSAIASLAHLRELREQGVNTFCSVGTAVTEDVRRAIRSVRDHLWHTALGAGRRRDLPDCGRPAPPPGRRPGCRRPRR